MNIEEKSQQYVDALQGVSMTPEAKEFIKKTYEMGASHMSIDATQVLTKLCIDLQHIVEPYKIGEVNELFLKALQDLSK